MNILEKVWLDRTTIEGDRRVPTFWNPQPLSEIGWDSVDTQLMCKLVALGLNLELPVGQLLDAQIKRIRGLQSGVAYQVLKAAQTDEGRHHKGFTMAQDALEARGHIVPTAQAAIFARELSSLPYHPITIAALLEVSLFLPFLAVMRLRGGQPFLKMANGINADEQRHTVVNASIATALGEPLSTCHKFRSLRDDILDFAVMGNPIEEEIRKASDELLQDLDSPSLNRLNGITAAVFVLPFENENREVYGRTTYVD